MWFEGAFENGSDNRGLQIVDALGRDAVVDKHGNNNKREQTSLQHISLLCRKNKHVSESLDILQVLRQTNKRPPSQSQSIRRISFNFVTLTQN